MNILKIISIVIIVVSAVAVMYIYRFNYASEKLNLAIWPGMAAALVSILFLAQICLTSDRIEIIFPMIYMYDQKNMLPFFDVKSSPYTSKFTLIDGSKGILIEKLEKKYPEYLEFIKGKEGYGRYLYSDILLYDIVNLLFYRYCFTWETVDTVYYDLPTIEGGRTTIPPNEKRQNFDLIGWNKILHEFPDNKVLQLEQPFQGLEQKEPVMLVPPKTTLRRISSGLTNEIQFGNDFVKINIKTMSDSSSQGLGELGKLIGYNQEENNKYRSDIFLIKMTAEFNKMRSGHPNMPSYRRWVELMFQSLEYRFNSEKRWKKTKEYYLLFKGKELIFSGKK